MPVKVKPEDVSLDDKIAFLMKINEAALKMPGVIRVQSNMAFDYEWKYLATSEGSYIEQEIWRTLAGLHRDGAQGRQVQVAHLLGGAEVGRLRGGDRGADARERRAHRRRGGGALHRAAGRASGSRTSIMTPAHAMLTIHEIVAHPTELDRVVGYEANYAGTSFVKVGDVGKLMMGSKLFNVTADRTLPGRHVHGGLRR